MIRCCYGCVPPKRYPGCHAVCEEYIGENEKHLEEKERRQKEQARMGELYDQRTKAVRKAMRRKRK